MPTTISFPLSQDPVYQARIRFTPYKVEPIDIEATKIFKAPIFDNIARYFGKSAEQNEIERGFAPRFLRGGGSPSELPADKAANQRAASDANKVFKGPTASIDSSFPLINLYVPVSLQFSDNIQYDGANLGGMGTTAMGLLSNDASLVASAFEGMAAGMSSVFSYLSGALTGEAARIASVQAARILPSGIQAAVQIGSQRIVNPNTKALFKGVNLREFTFQFKMIPTSEQEAQSVDAIIRTFRTCMYPEAFDPTETDENLPFALKFPNQFKIDFFFGGTRLKTQKIELSYLRNVSVVYNSSGGGYHKGGWPTEIDLSLSFMETRTLSKKDIGPQHGVEAPLTSNPVSQALANNSLQLSTRDDGGL